MEEINKEEINLEKKKSGRRRYVLYLTLVIVITVLAIFLSLKDNFNETIHALKTSDWRYLVLIVVLVSFSYLIDGLIIFVFARLYTRRYHYYQGLATSMVGAFFNSVTPSASGGQIMQVYTMRKQNVEPSNGASIMVMSFILYQIVLVILGIIAVAVKSDLLFSMEPFNLDLGFLTIKNIPINVLTIIGFVLNLSVILLLFLMSYSHRFHNFIMHFGIGLGSRLKLIKKPEEIRESLRIQVENFKIELRRLQSNIPVTLLIMLLFAISLISKYSIPWISGVALNAYNETTLGAITFKGFWDSVFLSSYHQMVTGLMPLPGSAGVSEYFFIIIFNNFYNTQVNTVAAQIIWRAATFHLIVLTAGLVTAFYRASPKEHIELADRKTFINLQMQTYEERKRSADTLYETARLSRKEIQEKLRGLSKFLTPKKTKIEDEENESEIEAIEEKKAKKPKKEKIKKPKKEKAKKKTKHFDDEDSWDTIIIK
ncbi:MAG: flippase-like domain-containing protein, partial [Erysipelotrichia bacterium]|nr:flippase-like domain-containing protein [Erysipelotrichia bacterium]